MEDDYNFCSFCEAEYMLLWMVISNRVGFSLKRYREGVEEGTEKVYILRAE